MEAATDREIDAAFESLVQAQTGALLVGLDLFLNSRIEQLVALAAHHAIPVMYSSPEFVVAGGLISYGTSLTESWRQVGLYAGRILKSEKPADLPVIQASKFELVINLKTARALGLAIPTELLAIADRVIESWGRFCCTAVGVRSWYWAAMRACPRSRRVMEGKRTTTIFEIRDS